MRNSEMNFAFGLQTFVLLFGIKDCCTNQINYPFVLFVCFVVVVLAPFFLEEGVRISEGTCDFMHHCAELNLAFQSTRHLYNFMTGFFLLFLQFYAGDTKLLEVSDLVVFGENISWKAPPDLVISLGGGGGIISCLQGIMKDTPHWLCEQFLAANILCGVFCFVFEQRVFCGKKK